jgi:hypothetical protein
VNSFDAEIHHARETTARDGDTAHRLECAYAVAQNRKLSPVPMAVQGSRPAEGDSKRAQAD